MKTSVNMIREMGQYQVVQRTKDAMFDATHLLKQWNKDHGRKDISDFLSNKATKEFIQAIADAENLNTGKVVLSRKGKKGGTWMHPYLFIDFAMWINPSFKVQVIKFVYDQLIQQRHLAGDNYVSLSASGLKLDGYDFRGVATAMNWIVFGSKAKNLRQTASQDQLQELADLEKKLSFAIDMGYIKTYDALIDEMRKIWNQKNRKF